MCVAFSALTTDSTANFRLPASSPSLTLDGRHDPARAKNSSTAVLFSTSGLGREQPVRQRERAKRRQGGRGTRRRGDGETGHNEWIKSRTLFIFFSPCLPVSPYPHLPLSPSPPRGLFFDIMPPVYDQNLVSHD